MDKYDLTLYQMAGSRSLRVAWLAAELGILDRIRVEEVDLMKGVQLTDSFRAMNKMSAVPTLVMTDKETKAETVMTESGAICLFLADNYAEEKRLKPAASNILGMAAYYRFIALAVSSIDPLLWNIRLHEQLLPEAMRAAAVAKKARADFLRKVVPVLEEVLGREGVRYVCEPAHEGFSAADAVLGYCCFWANSYGLLDDSPLLKAYFGRLKQRDAFRTGLRKKAAL